MDFGLAFSFPFKDEDWVIKILIAGLIGIIPLIGQIALLGWMIEVSRRVIKNDPEQLPGWSNFGGLLVLGLKGIVIGIVVAIPYIILSIPFPLMAIDDSGTLVAIYSFCFSCFAILYAILLIVAVPASYGLLAATDDLGEALNVGKILDLVRAAPGAYIIAFLGTILASIIGSLGIILCFVGVVFTTAYAFSVQGHLYGQAYNEAQLNLPAPVEA
ncbi:MAG: DUF4013 domain-containing protein [Anaerolineales bacterium]|nr:DUF4013 domain-containing protein [Anaerolineales bacterium]